MKKIDLFIWSVAVSSPAFSAMPAYEPKAYCDYINHSGGPSARKLRLECQINEQAQFDWLKSEWDSLPENIRDTCKNLTTFQGHPAYSILAACVENVAAPPAD